MSENKTDEQVSQQFSSADYSIAMYEQLARRDLIDLFHNPYRAHEQIIGEFKKEDLKKAIKNPENLSNQKILRKISRYAYNVSMHYKRLINYMADMAIYRYYVEPIGTDLESVTEKKFLNTYKKITNKLTNMKIPHEYGKMMRTFYRDGVFFGYVHSNKDSFFIEQLDPDYCLIDGQVDGTLTFSFNFNYFFTYPERLTMFPEEFQEKFNNLVNLHGKKSKLSASYWQHIDYEGSICLKVDDTTALYPIPPFVSLFADILDIQDFKDLQKAKGEIENYKLVTMKIPQKEGDKAEANQFMLSPDWVAKFYAQTKKQMPSQIGLTATTMDVDVVDFEKDRPDKNKVLEAQQVFWDTAGVSGLLFQSGDSAVGMRESIKVDESTVFFALRQLESWTNRYLYKFQDKKIKWVVKFLDMTIFNEEKVQDAYLKAAQYGGLKTPWLASMGYSATSTLNLAHFENNILKLQDNMIPLKSSHTQTEIGGRPAKDDGDLGDKGLETRDNLGNENRE